MRSYCPRYEVRFGKNEIIFEKRRLNPPLVATGGRVVEIEGLGPFAVVLRAVCPDEEETSAWWQNAVQYPIHSSWKAFDPFFIQSDFCAKASRHLSRTWFRFAP
jgi:hypothetical protein